MLTWDSRGFGESEGLVELDSPDFEVRDVQALLDWTAARPNVRLDAPGDPVAGMSGASYAGGVQLLAAAREPRIDAIAPEVTWHDLRHSLAPNGVLKVGWVGLLYAMGQLASHLGTVNDPARLHPNAEGMDPLLAKWLTEALAANRVSDEAAEGLLDRSLAGHLAGLERFPPTMLVHGWRDTLFTPNEAVWTHHALHERGFTACILLHGGGHGHGTPGEAYVWARTLDFLDYWLLDTAAPVPPDLEVYQPWDGHWSVLPEWPGDPGRARERLELGAQAIAGAALPTTGYLAPEAEGGLVAVPNLLAPTSHTELPGLHGMSPLPSFDAPGASALFQGPVLAEARVLLGTPRLHLALRGPIPDAALFVKLLDVAPDGGHAVLGNQVTPVRLESGGLEASLDLELAAVAHELEPGHRLGLLLSASDLAHSGSRGPLPVLVRADGSSWLEMP